MPLSLFFRPSFERSLKRLSLAQLKTIGLILETLKIYYASNCSLSEAQKIAPRFFYKKLRHSYYESGVESQIRTVLVREGDRCIALLAGNHDQISRFLAEN